MALPPRCGGNGVEGVFNGFVVQRFLFFAETHPFTELHLFRQVGNDRLVGFETAQDEGADPRFEIA